MRVWLGEECLKCLVFSVDVGAYAKALNFLLQLDLIRYFHIVFIFILLVLILIILRNCEPEALFIREEFCTSADAFVWWLSSCTPWNLAKIGTALMFLSA